MTFHEIRFPTAISFHSSGGPARKTEIVTLGSGYEERNAVWANSRRRYDVGYGVKTLDDLHAVIAFFEARMARLYGFRLQGFLRFQILRAGRKRFGRRSGDRHRRRRDHAVSAREDLHLRSRELARARSKSLSIRPRAWRSRGVEQMSGFTVDTTTGIVTFTTAPSASVAITAGFEFDTPVRFDTDQLSINLSDFAGGRNSVHSDCGHPAVKTLPSGMQDHLDSGATTLCWCWKIARARRDRAGLHRSR